MPFQNLTGTNLSRKIEDLKEWTKPFSRLENYILKRIFVGFSCPVSLYIRYVEGSTTLIQSSLIQEELYVSLILRLLGITPQMETAINYPRILDFNLDTMIEGGFCLLFFWEENECIWHKKRKTQCIYQLKILIHWVMEIFKECWHISLLIAQNHINISTNLIK